MMVEKIRDKRKNKVSNNKYKKYHKKTQYIFYVAIFLVLVLGVVLLSEYCDFSKIEKRFRDPVLFNIDDECSYIMGNIVHQIRDTADCSIRCHNQCIMIDSSVKDVEFFTNEGSCNTCKCYCK